MGKSTVEVSRMIKRKGLVNIFKMGKALALSLGKRSMKELERFKIK